MAAEIERIAHFYGEGLPTPVEVLRAKLGEKGVVYFLSQCDREAPQQVPAIAMTTRDDKPSIGRFESDESGEGRDIYNAMLVHAALYGPALTVSEEDRAAIQFDELVSQSSYQLRQAQIYRARYLPGTLPNQGVQ
jgi:hypothetical protein